MSKRFHINVKGNPGECEAFEGNCPYGTADKHFNSQDAARKAFEASNESFPSFIKVKETPLPISAEEYMKEGGTSDDYSDMLGVILVRRGEEQKARVQLLTDLRNSHNVKLKHRERAELARTSSDPATLMAIAESIKKPAFSRKLAAALASNPNTPAPVLVEARSRTDIAWKEFTELEMHPNYPPAAFTGEGATMFTDRKSAAEVMAVLESNEAGDQLVEKASYKEEETKNDYGVFSALRNSENNVSDRIRSQYAVNSDVYARAASLSGKFPSEKDLNGTSNYYYRNQVESFPGGSRMSNGEVPVEKMAIAAQYNPDEAKISAIYSKYKNTSSNAAIAKAVFANPAASQELKTSIAKDMGSWISEAQDLINKASN